MALTKIKTSNLETSIDLTGINDTATSQILTVSDTGIDVTGTVTADGLTVENNTTDVKGTVKNTLTSGVRTATLDILPQNDGDYGVSIQASGGDGTGTFQFNNKNIMKFDFSNDISFYEDTGTTAKFFWDASTERLGIGTSSPSANLHLSGESQTIKLETTNDSSTFLNIRANSGTGGSFYVGQDSSAGSSFGRGAYAGVVWQSGAYPIVLATNNTERMRIDSSGNVGIGVTPSAWTDYNVLEMPSNSYIMNQGGWFSTINNAYYNSGSWKYKNNGYANQAFTQNGKYYWQVASSGTADNAISWTTAMTIPNAGALVQVGTTNTSLYAQTSGVGGVAIGRTHAANGSAVQIGTDASTGWACAYMNRWNIGSDARFVQFSSASSVVGSITGNNSSTYYNTSSDYRLKENVVPMTGSIDRVKALNPSRFNFIADPDTTVDGFLAHEAQTVVPEAITGEKDAMKTEEYEVTPAVMDGETVVTPAVMGEREVEDYQGIDQSKLVPLLVGALQEQQTLIESLTTRLEALEGV